LDYGAVVGQTGGSVGGVSTQINQFSSYSLSGGTLTASATVANIGLLLVSGAGRALTTNLWNAGFVQISGANASVETGTTHNNGTIVLKNAHACAKAPLCLGRPCANLAPVA